jgi:hypothetical protein
MYFYNNMSNLRMIYFAYFHAAVEYGIHGILGKLGR